MIGIPNEKLDINAEVINWNPWHGCKRMSEGCEHCYLFERDFLVGYEESDRILFNKKAFYMPLRKKRVYNAGLDKYKMEYKIKSGSTFYVCDMSDFFIEEADYYRKRAWKIIRERSDCLFIITTKRIDRFMECIPETWGITGWPNVMINVSVENDYWAEKRITKLLEIPARYKGIEVAPLLSDIHIEKYLCRGNIDKVTVSGEISRHVLARKTYLDLVKNIYDKCKTYDIDFEFINTGSKYVKQDELIKVKNETDGKALAEFINLKIETGRLNWKITTEELELVKREENAAIVRELIRISKQC